MVTLMDNLRGRAGTACIVAIAGATNFCVLTVIAMLVYPGGTHADPSTTGYTFHMNFFSDLGATVTPSGMVNTCSSVLFFIALTGIGVTFMPYLARVTSLFGSNDKAIVNLGKAGSVFGIVSAIAFIGIAFTPYDLALSGHILFVQVAFTGLIPVGICFSVSIFKGNVLPLKYGAILLAFTIVAVAYIVLLFSGLSASEGGVGASAITLAINAIGQKVIVYDAIVSLSIMVFGSYRKAREKPVTTDG